MELSRFRHFGQRMKTMYAPSVNSPMTMPIWAFPEDKTASAAKIATPSIEP